MSGKNINFDDKKIKRSSFYKNKKINNIEDIDVMTIDHVMTIMYKASTSDRIC